MKTIVIDDEPWMLRHFCETCAGVEGIELADKFRNPLLALKYAEENPVELAFVDVEMPQLNGPETAKGLMERRPEIQIVFISAYAKSSIEAMHDLPVSGYLRKPYNREDLQAIVDKITGTV